LTVDNWTSSLEILYTRQYDSGEVKAIAENSEGAATALARLKVTPRNEEPYESQLATAPMVPPLPKPALKKNLSQKSFHIPDQQPVFTQRLQPCRITSGKPANFSCQFHSTTSVRIEWYREDRRIETSSDFQITSTDNTTTLFIPQAFVEDSGNFTVHIANEFGESESTATLVVEG
jgi:Immunoglobulin I-set domain